jgi:hypothetical protein
LQTFKISFWKSFARVFCNRLHKEQNTVKTVAIMLRLKRSADVKLQPD